MLFGGMRESYIVRRSSSSSSSSKGGRRGDRGDGDRGDNGGRESVVDGGSHEDDDSGSHDDDSGGNTSRRDGDGESIVIEDMAHPVFLKVLEFLYTDELALVEVEDQTELLSVELAVQLLIAAERFLLPRLKALCEDRIRKQVTVANVVSTFLAAHRHRAFGLKDTCLDFLLEHLEVVKAGPSFAELKAEPDLLMEIIMRGT
mmetsp:Transcript_44441/g.75620  ORF Transcript_44441/g.75620 Transcript_44441/m.75620 type:complete len:202 (+) Transcript_44441:322-927(+)